MKVAIFDFFLTSLEILNHDSAGVNKRRVNSKTKRNNFFLRIFRCFSKNFKETKTILYNFTDTSLFGYFYLNLTIFLEKMTGKKDVLVIGAGPAGMVTVAALKEHCNVKVIINQREIIKMNPKFSLKITSSN